MLVLKRTIRGGRGAPWFYLTFMGMPERLFLLVFWSEDLGEAMAVLNA